MRVYILVRDLLGILRYCYCTNLTQIRSCLRFSNSKQSPVLKTHLPYFMNSYSTRIPLAFWPGRVSHSPCSDHDQENSSVFWWLNMWNTSPLVSANAQEIEFRPCRHLNFQTISFISIYYVFYVVAMIMCAFGQTMVDYVVNLCQGHIDYMQRLPHNVVRRILGYTELEDIAKVSVVNKTFHKVSDSSGQVFRLKEH